MTKAVIFDSDNGLLVQFRAVCVVLCKSLNDNHRPAMQTLISSATTNAVKHRIHEDTTQRR